MAGTTCHTCGVLSRGRHCTECEAVPSPRRGRFSAARLRRVRCGLPTSRFRAVAVLAVVVIAGLAGFGGGRWTDATFTDSQAITGNDFGTATLLPPTTPVVRGNLGTLVLTWGVTPSIYADGYKVYRAATSGGTYAEVATVPPRATTTWTDATPPVGTSWYKLTAYRYNWRSGTTAESLGTDPAAVVLTGTLSGTTVPASWTSVLGATSYTLNRAGPAAAAMFNMPGDVAIAANGTVYVADYGNHRIRKVTAAGVVTTLAGSGTAGFANGTGVAAQFNNPRAVAVAADGTVYVADQGNNRIRKVMADGTVSTLAGSGTAGFANGTGVAAQFKGLSGVAVATDGTVYVGDLTNQRIRKVMADGTVSTLAGSGTAGFADGTGGAAQFNGPSGVAVAADGTVYVADSINQRIRKVMADGTVSTLAGRDVGFAEGTGVAAAFSYPLGVAVGAGGTVYVADSTYNRIRKVMADGVVTTLAGSMRGFADSAVVVSAVYTGPGPYTDTALVAGTSYTYSVTAAGPGTVSNTIGPFVRAVGPVVVFTYTGAPQTYTVPAGVTSLAIVAQGSVSIYGGATNGGRASGNLAVTPGQVLEVYLQHDDLLASDSALVLTSRLLLSGPGGDGEGGLAGHGWYYPLVPITGGASATGVNSGAASVTITYVP